MTQMFNSCPAFNSPIIFDTSSVIDMRGMFALSGFNQPLIQGVNGWDTSSVADMKQMFASNSAFQQDISSWDISSVTDFTSFMVGKTPATWSQTNFNNLLCGWSPQTVNPNLGIDFGSAVYTTVTAQPCYDVLDLVPNNWFINSGGGV
jgi:surface protein